MKPPSGASPPNNADKHNKRPLEAQRAASPPSPSRANGARPTRKRKKTRMFEMAAYTPARRVSTGALGKTGLGQRLADIPNVAYHVQRAQVNDAELLFIHRLLFNFAGVAHVRKANIRAFSGFVFESERERARVRDKLARAHLNMVRKVARFLDVSVTTNGHAPPHSARLDADKRALLAEAMGMDDTEISEACGERSDDVSDASSHAKATMKGAREATMTAGKEQLITALLLFLERPRAVQGRQSLAQRDKQLRRERKEADKMRAQKKALLARQRRDSDEDGDEDLETGGTTWIQLAATQAAAAAAAAATSTTNGHA
ncbi:unnamed protein product [Agarophyton chilense]